MPRTIQNELRIEEKYREVLENHEGNLTLGYKEQTLFGDNKKQYVEYMTGITTTTSYEDDKIKYTTKENDTFHFISLEVITNLQGGIPDGKTALQLDCEITGRIYLMDLDKEPTNMDAIITPPYEETTVNIDLEILEYMVMPHNISGRLDYNGKILPETDTKHTLDGESRDIAKSAVYDDLKVILPTEKYVEKHKDKLGYGQLHSLVAAGDKVKNKYDCIKKILTSSNPEMIINQQYAEDPNKPWTINPWKENTPERWLGPTPLHVAIEKKNVGAVILLISVGAKTDMVSTEHKNMTQKEYIKYLLNDNKNDPDLKQISEYVRNPDVLKWAIKHPYKEITSYVKAGISLKQKIPGANFIYKKLKNFIKSIRESFPEDLYSVGNNYSKIESSDKVPYRTYGRPEVNQDNINLIRKLGSEKGKEMLRKYKENKPHVENGNNRPSRL